MNKNVVLEIMFKIDELKQRVKDLKGVARTFLNNEHINAKKMYLGLMNEAEKVQAEIFSLQIKLAKVGIRYE